ncbi:type IX secretion system plug protein [Sphingobacterium nematocida]|nr:type IX secretion system plug protein domain-containing protein [Sphingobacterium nematocida]
MFKVKPFFVLFLLLPMALVTQAQKKKKKRVYVEQSPKQELLYKDVNYINDIKSVQLYPIGKESQLPIYTLGDAELLKLSFDDLRADVRSYYYSIEHCNADWTPSRLSSLDYAEGYNEDRIVETQQSQGTLQPYTHYKTVFPNEYVRPKVAGNFLLKVYEDADKQRLILTRRFYVVKPLVAIESQVLASSFANKRLTNQKLNVTIKTGLTISNPHRDIQIHVMQNQRPDNAMVLRTPMFIGTSEIKYNNSETLDFLGNNEFRYADLRSFKGGSAQIQDIQIDSLVDVLLFTDKDNNGETYATTYDENGKFYIRNLDYGQEDISGDYADVTFSLQTKENVGGSIYVVGGFNNYQHSPNNQLKYNVKNQKWEVTLKLKQGLYDYEYVLVTPDGNTVTDAFSGSHFQTGNDYQILVYYRRTGTYWDELLGVGSASINNKENKN